MTQSIQVSNRPGPAQKGFAQTDGQLLSKGNYSELMTEFFEWLPKCEARKYHISSLRANIKIHRCSQGSIQGQGSVKVISISLEFGMLFCLGRVASGSEPTPVEMQVAGLWPSASRRRFLATCLAVPDSDHDTTGDYYMHPGASIHITASVLE